MIPLLLLVAVGGLMHAARSFATDSTGTQLAFGFLLLSAYLTAKIVSRFGLPKLTGYIIAGVVAGPYVLELVTSQMAVSLKVVSSAATAIIALEAGAELQLDKIRPMMRTLSAITAFAVVGSAVVIGGALFAMRPMLSLFDGMDMVQTVAVCALLGFALSAKSPAVAMAMISETRSQGPLSSAILASVVVADLCVIVCFSIASAITSALIGGGIDVGATVLAVCWELFGSMAFGVAIGMLIGQFLRSVREGASLFALLVCVVVGEIGTRVQLDPLIVMLAAGIWLRNFSRADARALLDGFQSAQLPVFLVFFALAGSKLDIGALAATIVPVLLIAGARAASFFVGTGIACRATGAPDIVTRYAWFGLLPQAGLALALALVLAKNFPSFGEQAAVILFGVVGFNECVAPVILRLVLVRSGEAGQKPGVDFADGGGGGGGGH
ncbi:MAG: cation:proton antiporter [Kofleriaceae bacterium]